ncbi:MAG: hypothetical protein PF503_07435 [Desulfobacula sp.]|jgi:hypothetical protein|nr:hypothetical protein [Desulfobacula sp.]
MAISDDRGTISPTREGKHFTHRQFPGEDHAAILILEITVLQTPASYNLNALNAFRH